MNTLRHVASLLPLLAASLGAQSLDLATEVHPAWIDAKVAGATDGALVVLVLGLRETRLHLPGDAVLGITPDLVAGLTISQGDGPARLGVRMPPAARSFDCFAQAVAVDPRLPLAERGAVTTSNVQRVRSHRQQGLPTPGNDELGS